MKRDIGTVSFRRLVCYNGKAKDPGAQTERRALASRGRQPLEFGR